MPSRSYRYQHISSALEWGWALHRLNLKIGYTTFQKALQFAFTERISLSILLPTNKTGFGTHGPCTPSAQSNAKQKMHMISWASLAWQELSAYTMWSHSHHNVGCTLRVHARARPAHVEASSSTFWGFMCCFRNSAWLPHFGTYWSSLQFSRKLTDWAEDQWKSILTSITSNCRISASQPRIDPTLHKPPTNIFNPCSSSTKYEDAPMLFNPNLCTWLVGCLMKSIKLNKKIQENTRFSMTLHKDATSQLLQVWKIGLHTWEKYVQDHHAQTPWCMSQPALANWSHELLLFVNAIQKHAGLGRPFIFTLKYVWMGICQWMESLNNDSKH